MINYDHMLFCNHVSLSISYQVHDQCKKGHELTTYLAIKIHVANLARWCNFVYHDCLSRVKLIQYVLIITLLIVDCL